MRRSGGSRRWRCIPSCGSSSARPDNDRASRRAWRQVDLRSRRLPVRQVYTYRLFRARRGGGVSEGGPPGPSGGGGGALSAAGGGRHNKRGGGRGGAKKR